MEKDLEKWKRGIEARLVSYEDQLRQLATSVEKLLEVCSINTDKVLEVGIIVKTLQKDVDFLLKDYDDREEI